MKIISDIDGTIADINHRLHYLDKKDTEEGVDWDSFFATAKNDVPIIWMIEIIKALHEKGAEIIFITGRNKNIEAMTRFWLDGVFNKMPYKLFMRPEKDFRPDYVIKGDILKKEKLAPQEILCVFDDRQQVVDMYRKKGFNVLQCAEGDF